jgi:hypothetical protein
MIDSEECINFDEWTAYRVSVKECQGKRQSEDLSIDGRIILKWISKDRVKRLCTGSI